MPRSVAELNAEPLLETQPECIRDERDCADLIKEPGDKAELVVLIAHIRDLFLKIGRKRFDRTWPIKCDVSFLKQQL